MEVAKAPEKVDKKSSSSLVGSIFAMAGAEDLLKKGKPSTPPKLNPVIESPADQRKRLDSKELVMRERELIKKKLGKK